MELEPKVSIIIPVYNGSDYLREAIDSALAQTYKNIEVIVVNDGSDDGGETEKIALCYVNKIRYFSKENGGVASALNLGISEMTGAYFSWLSHDDIYLPQKVATQVSHLAQEGSDAISFSYYEGIDAKSNYLQTYEYDVKPEKIIYALFNGQVNGCTLLIPRKCFDEAGVFDTSLKTTQDYHLWYRMAKKFRFECIPQVLFRSRIHPSQGSRTINTYLEEQNDLFIWALREFTINQITGENNVDSAAEYLRLGLLLKQRGFTRAYKYTRTLGLNNLLNQKGIFYTRNYLLYLYSLVWNRRFTLKYWKYVSARVFKVK